jgi:hypothetical protein
MKIHDGEHVRLKGWGLTGYSGTVINRTLTGYYHVQLDPGQSRLGHTILHGLRKMNLRKDDREHSTK